MSPWQKIHYCYHSTLTNRLLKLWSVRLSFNEQCSMQLQYQEWCYCLKRRNKKQFIHATKLMIAKLMADLEWTSSYSSYRQPKFQDGRGFCNEINRQKAHKESFALMLKSSSNLVHIMIALLQLANTSNLSCIKQRLVFDYLRSLEK